MVSVLQMVGYLPTDEEFQKQVGRYKQLYYAFEAYIEDEKWRDYLRDMFLEEWKTPLQVVSYVQKHPLPTTIFGMSNVVLVNEQGILYSEDFLKEFNQLLKKIK